MKKLAINITLSLGILVLCVYLVWPSSDEKKQHIAEAYASINWANFLPYLLLYIALLAIVHLCRSYRWHSLLKALDKRVSTAQLIAINSVGFMAILALPVRLGEFVRPALLKKYAGLSGASGLGAVAVERVMDGLLVSSFVFVTFLAMHESTSPDWMLPTAIVAFSVFTAGLTFLVCALKWPLATAKWSVALTLTPRFAPRIAEKLQAAVERLIRGFEILRSWRCLLPFVLWTFGYWIANGLGMWIVAQGMGIELSLLGAYATMGLLAVGMMVPNTPGMAFQFQYFTILGLSLFIGTELAETTGMVYAIVIHILQFIWYIGIGGLFLFSPLISLGDILKRKTNEPEPST